MLDSILGFIGKGLDAFSSSSNTEKNNATQLKIAADNIALQKEFAQSGVRWKVDDARAAGIHPLAALGAQTSSFSPVSVGLDKPETNFSGMGQDLGRALKAASSNAEREAQDERESRRLELEGKRLSNDALRAEIASKQIRNSRISGQVGPPMPMPGDRVPLPRPGPARTMSEGIAVSDDDIKQKGEDYPGTKIVRPFGYPLLANPYFNDGQQFEDRYGDSEIGSTAKFGINTVADHLYSGWHWGVPYIRGAISSAVRGGDRSRYRYRGFNDDRYRGFNR